MRKPASATTNILIWAFILGGASNSALALDKPLLITLTGQSMIRSDIRATAPTAVSAIQSLIQG